MSRRRVAALSAVLAGTFALAACGAGPSRGAADWVVEHDTIGDTVVVRTVLARDPAPASSSGRAARAAGAATRTPARTTPVTR